jgi:nucleoside-diphosphate-sugar epimerase
MKVMITGANGLVGRHACEQFVAKGMFVRAAVRSCSTVPHATETINVGEIDGNTSWQSVLTGVDVVVHLAARVHVMNDRAENPAAEFRRVNVDASLNLARQAAVAGVRRLIFVSTAKVHGEFTAPGQMFSEQDPPSPTDAYAISKWEAEQGLHSIAKSTGLEVVIVRPPLVYGPGVRANFLALINLVRRGWPLPFASVANARSLIALGNLVDFIGTCMTHPAAANQAFLVSDGHDLSTAELVGAIARAADMPVRLFSVPAWLLLLAGRLTGQSKAMERLCKNLQLDISKARTQLHWQPKLGVAEGLSMAVKPESRVSGQ